MAGKPGTGGGRINGGSGGRGARYLAAEQAIKRDALLRELAICGGDERFIMPGLPEQEIRELQKICARCPVSKLCDSWAQEQPVPVGFVVAAGRRYVAWTTCEICGKRCRGLPRCNRHRYAVIGLPEDFDLETALLG